MLPRDLQAEQFADYPPQARTLAVANLATLRQLPLAFLPSLLRELIEYDVKFPAERTAIDHELNYLRSLTPQALAGAFKGFAQIKLSPELERGDWVNHPAQFTEQQSAYLWTAHGMDAFRESATRYGDLLRTSRAPSPLPTRRLGIALVGQDATVPKENLFRNLAPHGTFFTNVNPANGLELLLRSLETRSATHPLPYAHWYIDGGKVFRPTPSLTTVSYQALEPARSKLLQYMQTEIARPGMGPEELRTDLARLAPAALGMNTGDPVLDRFQLKLFTEGSGTQIFSTTFAQWTAREALRRAEPLTLMVRFAPRQRQRPMNELLANQDDHPELDPAGSLVDAEMASYYHWINQRRLPEADQSAFLIWFEGRDKALVIAPTLPRSVRSTSEVDIKQLLTLATS